MLGIKTALIRKAKEADRVLDALGVGKNTETGKQIRGAIALELLGEKYEMQDKYSKAAFIKSQGAEVMTELRKLLQQEGILTRKTIEHKDKK